MRIVALFLMTMLLWTPLVAGVPQVRDPALHAMVVEGIELTFRQQYAAADSLFRRVAQTFPDHPAGYLYQAAILQTRAMDFELEIEKVKFDSLLEIGIQKAEQIVKDDPGSPWGHYFLGTAYGYDSYARVYRGDWLSGALKGLSSVSEFRKAVALDSTLSDAYAGIGTFYYWRSRRTEYFNWLPFLGDDRREAFDLLERTIQLGVYNRYTAISMLVAIYTDAGRFGDAERVAQTGLERYPGNRMFLWGLATANHKAKRYREAAEAYEALLQSILGDTNNHYNEIVCRLNLVRVRLALNDSTGVQGHLNVIASYESHDFPARLRERVRDKFEQARAIGSGLAGSRRRDN